MKQINLFKEKLRVEFGGTLNLHRRKKARPLDTKRSTHLVLKATNSFVLLRNIETIEHLTSQFSRRFGIKIYQVAVHADHVHLSIKISSRQLYCRWIRALTSGLVRRIAGLKFALLPYSRIVNWGRQFKSVQAYISENFAEGDFILNAHLVVERWFDRERAFG